jgi:adenine deaminase
MVLGTDDKAMAVAGNALIEAGGGFAVVVDGQIEPLCRSSSRVDVIGTVAVAAKQVRAVEDAIKKQAVR